MPVAAQIPWDTSAWSFFDLRFQKFIGHDQSRYCVTRLPPLTAIARSVTASSCLVSGSESGGSACGMDGLGGERCRSVLTRRF